VPVTTPEPGKSLPDYDGNGMFKSLGNVAANPRVGLLFIAIGSAEMPARLRVNGTASVAEDDPLLEEFPGAQLLVRPEHIFPNCPRYIPGFEATVLSPYTPRPGVVPLEPEWKSREALRDVVPRRRG